MKGTSFLSGGNLTEILHLHVVISDADEEFNCLVVPVTTWREDNGKPLRWQDKSCVLQVGAHPFIRHKSWIFYARARAMSFKEIYDGIRNGLLVEKEKMSDIMVLEIQQGAKDTKFLPGELKHFFNYF